MKEGVTKQNPSALLLALSFSFFIERCHVEQKEQGSGREDFILIPSAAI